MGMHVNAAEDGDYTAAFTHARNAGVDFVNILLIWGDGGLTNLPAAPLTTDAAGTMFDFALLDIANSYYPAYNMKVSLTIAALDTVHKFVPVDFINTPFDDATMIARFNLLLDNLFLHIPNLELLSLQIGNEVDAPLGTNATAWAQYRTFFEATAAHARTLRPGLPVSVTTTLRGITSPGKQALAQSLYTNADTVSVTYYPMGPTFQMDSPSVVTSDFAALAALYPPPRPIFLQEAGYSSGSTYVAGSTELQRQFVSQVFGAWDVYAANIWVVSFLNLTEWSTATVDGFGTQYGICPGSVCNEFKEFLQTLGLRTYAGSGVSKPAFQELRLQAAARGWPVQ
jgi:hypothetical protein